MVISVATIVMSRAPPRNTNHFVQSEVIVGGDGGGGDGGDGGGCDGDCTSSGGDSVVKAPVALQALRLSEPIALIFQ